jgi:entericidin B
MRTSLLVVWLALFGAVMTGCNTTRGVGEDVEAAGDAVQDAAQTTEDKLKGR